jgi:hypothetical protein
MTYTKPAKTKPQQVGDRVQIDAGDTQGDPTDRWGRPWGRVAAVRGTKILVHLDHGGVIWVQSSMLLGGRGQVTAR